MKFLSYSLDALISSVAQRSFTWPHANIETARGALYIPNPSPDQQRFENDTLIYISPASQLDLSADISIGAFSMIGHGAQLLTHDHPLYMTNPKHLSLLELYEQSPSESIALIRKIIQQDVWIHRATILPKCNFIAQGVIIGAGAVVTKPIFESFSVWAGNPAKKISCRPPSEPITTKMRRIELCLTGSQSPSQDLQSKQQLKS